MLIVKNLDLSGASREPGTNQLLSIGIGIILEVVDEQAIVDNSVLSDI